MARNQSSKGEGRLSESSSGARGVPADAIQSGVWKRSEDPDVIWHDAHLTCSRDLFQWFLARAASQTDAELLHGDTFDTLLCKLHEEKENGGAILNVRAMLFTIGENKLRDHRRHVWRVGPPDGELDLETLPANEPSPESRLAAAQTAARTDALVQDVLDDLPPSDAGVLRVANDSELTQKEIAAQLDMPLPTFATKLQRARKEFARLFKARAPWWGVAVTLAIVALWRWLWPQVATPSTEVALAVVPEAVPNVTATSTAAASPTSVPKPPVPRPQKKLPPPRF